MKEKNKDLTYLKNLYSNYFEHLPAKEYIYLEFLSYKERKYDIYVSNNELILKANELSINIKDFINNQRLEIGENKVNFTFAICNSNNKQGYFVSLDINNNNFVIDLPEIGFYEKGFLMSLYHELGHIFGNAFFTNGKTGVQNEFIARERAIKFDYFLAKSIGSNDFLAMNDFKTFSDLAKYINYFISYSGKLTKNEKFTEDKIHQLIHNI